MYLYAVLTHSLWLITLLYRAAGLRPGLHPASLTALCFSLHVSFSTKRSAPDPRGQRRSSLSGFLGNAAGSAAASDAQVRLHVGMQVLLSSAGETAFIRYLGAAHFAPGLWLGLELRSPKGKNDGSVGGRRYFSCRAGHGVLVRPSRVTYRGISGSRLVSDGHRRPQESQEAGLPVY